MSKLTIREANRDDLEKLLTLYTHLHDNKFPNLDLRILGIWVDIMNDPQQHIIGGFIGDKMVSSCVVIIIKNLTHGQRPYALVENVITHSRYRGRGYATEILNFARNLARKNGCYKIMLMTGSKEESILEFYERAGYNREDKTAFIQWLK